MSRELVFSVTIHDCEVQTFRAGGKGGQNQNKRDTGVRVIHHPSGARGESREMRTQLENKRNAFERMAKSREFQWWAKVTAASLPSIEETVTKWMAPENLLVECRAREGDPWDLMQVDVERKEI